MRQVAIVVAVLWLTGCGAPETAEVPEREITPESVFANNLGAIPAMPGFAGFFDVPEMLCLSIADSAPAPQVAARVERAYNFLESDLAHTKAERNGPYGQITYNNDTLNFVFECFALIRRMPQVAPYYTKVVVLEADHMLAYNHYGAYNTLYRSYAELRGLLQEMKLRQTGPLREHYVTDPREVNDPSKLRTLLLVPVRRDTLE